MCRGTSNIEEPPIVEELQVDSTSILPTNKQSEEKVSDPSTQKIREVQHKCKVYMGEMSVS
uniref:Putative ovule protein n=1 Tax=Solanum chacoense TaxID=4108 RepID=A0A0V0H6U9_SOLCH